MHIDAHAFCLLAPVLERLKLRDNRLSLWTVRFDLRKLLEA